MTKVNKFINILINQFIKSSKLEYLSDTSWSYTFETESISIRFTQQEDGSNEVEEFNVNQSGVWFTIVPTDEQLKLMFEKLNETPYREVEQFTEAITDYYNHFGVQRSNFY
jgi:hypothetical protein